MPLVSPPLPPQIAEIRPFLADSESPHAHGPEGEQVRMQLASVSEHWQQRTLAGLVDDFLEYRHVPFEQVGTRKVRYIQLRRLTPRSAEFPEDVE